MPQSTTAEVIDLFNHAFVHHAPVPPATDSEARA